MTYIGDLLMITLNVNVSRDNAGRNDSIVDIAQRLYKNQYAWSHCLLRLNVLFRTFYADGRA